MNANKTGGILIALCVFGAIVILTVQNRASSAIGAAQAREALAQQALLEAEDSLQAITEYRDSVERADSAAAAAYADSVAAWSEERARLRARVREEQEHHSSLADSVRVRVDSAAADMVTRMEESFDSVMVVRDSIEASKDAQITALGNRVLSLETLTGALRAENDVLRARAVAQRSVEDALRGQISGEKNKKRVAYIVAGAAIALAAVR